MHETAFVYSPDKDAWISANDAAPRPPKAPVLPAGSAYAPLLSLLRSTPSATLTEARRRVALLDREELLLRYRAAHAGGKRLVAFIMASELVERGIPPGFWRGVLALDDGTVDKRADLMLADLAWLRRWHPDHVRAVRYKRGRALLSGSEAVFIREAEFAFYQGKRQPWKIVGSLSMTERQQWEAAYLRSTPIKRAAEVTKVVRPKVLSTLHDELRTTRRTSTFGEAEAATTLARRIALWDCSRIVKDGSPTEVAARYLQMTGIAITRQAAAKHLEKVRAILRVNGDDLIAKKDDD